ncbi:MAG: hypothetical protein R3C16_01480 [Hyphomonadaceae bacterium]
MGARVDLRVGALAAGVVEARAEPSEAFGFSNLARMLRSPHGVARRGLHAPLTLAVASDVQASLEADLLSEAATRSRLHPPYAQLRTV